MASVAGKKVQGRWSWCVSSGTAGAGTL